MRRYFNFLFLVFWVGFSTIAKAQAISPSINVTGEASIKIAPDQVAIPVTIYAEEMDAAAAREAAEKKLKAALSIAKKLEIPENQLKTLYTQVMPQYDYNNGKQILRNYMASSTIDFTLSDTQKLVPLMKELTDAGIDRIGSARFGLVDEKKIRDDLLSKAVQDARSKAYAIAGALGGKVGKVLTVSENGAVNAPSPMPVLRGSAMAMEKSAPPPDLPGGQIEVNQSINASFAIE